MILVAQDKIEHYVAQGWWGERTLGELFIDTAERQPEALAVADPPNLGTICGRAPRRWSWGELLAQVGRHAAFLHHEVPGMEIPAPILARLREAGETRGAETGLDIAAETIAALRPQESGAFILPPFGRFEAVPQLLDRLGLWSTHAGA